MPNSTPVIAFNSIGAANYLIIDGINGFLCPENDLSDMINKLMRIKGAGESLRVGALKTIDIWNYRVAGERFIEVLEKINKGTEIDECYYSNGLFSKA